MRIHTHPADPILRLTCSNIVVPVIERDSYEEIVEGMIELLLKLKAVGLAAPQVGIEKQIVVMDPGQTGAPFVMLNPIRNGIGVDFKWGIEGCLSIPRKEFRVRRRKAVSVEWRDLDGKPYSRRFDGFAARVIQHELDHLQGELICDHGREVRSKR